MKNLIFFIVFTITYNSYGQVLVGKFDANFYQYKITRYFFRSKIVRIKSSSFFPKINFYRYKVLNDTIFIEYNRKDTNIINFKFISIDTLSLNNQLFLRKKRGNKNKSIYNKPYF